MRFFIFFKQYVSVLVVLSLLAVCGDRLPAQNQGFLVETQPMPQPRQMHGSAVIGDYLYIISGAVGVQITPSVVMARIGPDGQLGVWQDTTPLAAPRLYIGNSALTLGGIVYVMGGSSGILTQENFNNVVYAKPGPDGHLSRWVESVPWPGLGLSCPTAVSTPGYLHILGGLDSSDMPTNTVYSIPVMETVSMITSFDPPVFISVTRP